MLPDKPQRPGLRRIAKCRRVADAVPVRQTLAHATRSALIVNVGFGDLQVPINHLGIAVLPDDPTEDFPNPVHVLPRIESGDLPMFRARPEDLRHSKRVAAFREFVTEEIVAYRKRQQS